MACLPLPPLLDPRLYVYNHTGRKEKDLRVDRKLAGQELGKKKLGRGDSQKLERIEDVQKDESENGR